MRRIAIIGAGQAGLQLGLGLLQSGYEVMLVSARSPEEIESGQVLSSQCMFASALETERALEIDFWREACPKIEGIGFTVPDGVGGKSIHWAARLDDVAQSVDQRIKIPRWMREFQRRGGQLRVKAADLQLLADAAREYDLVVVSTGRGAIGQFFERDESRSPYADPQRALALTYVRNLRPRMPFPAVSFNLIPNVGEYFVFPALTTSGPCDIMVFEAIPGGPMDRWSSVNSPQKHLACSKQILERFLPWEAERCADIDLTDAQGTLVGCFAPTVRKPVAALPSGKHVLGMADAVVLNDPLTGQGANSAAKAAEIYLENILQRGDRPADAEWMQSVFEHYWTGYARWVVEWTNAMLHPPAHVLRVLDAAGKIEAVARAVVNGFDDATTLFPWIMNAAAAETFVQQEAKAVADRFEKRDYRRALGQFATGVTVVTARAHDGRKLGITVNSFSSVSLDPPLILWSLSRNSSNLADFTTASHFAVNVLEAKQHHLSRQFSTPQEDKFAGVEYAEGPAGVPLLNGCIACLICRNVRQYDGGDHVILLGEVKEYRYQEGEPLVFHSGKYRVATRHPDLAE